MRTSLLTLAFICASVPATRVQAQVPELDALRPTIDRIFADWQDQAHAPGLVYGIVKDGRLAYLNTRGVQDLERRRPVTADSLFRIASMSKAFTALAILKLRDEGRLRLDEPAETYVPEMRGWRYPTADSPRITVRDLLSHTGGFVTDDPWGDRQQVLTPAEFTRMLREGVPFTRTPGTAFEYSNFGYALLGRIITNVSGRPYRDYIEQTIMRPLGMASTGYEVTDWPLERRAIGYRWENERHSEEPTMRHGEFGAMGGVQTSAADYAKWVAFLLSAWPARDGAEAGPVQRASIRELAQGLNYAAVRPVPGAPAETCPMAAAYGKGFIAGQQCELGAVMFHGGGYPGYGSFLLLLPDHNVGLFALSNRTYAGPTPAVFAVARELHRAGLLTGRTLPVSPALAQTYQAAGAMYRAGGVGDGSESIDMNLLLERSAENWAGEFARLKGEVGECRTDAPITATGALAGRFTWTCDKGRLRGDLLLAPTNPPTIQALRLSPQTQ
jgi:serine-type D-Ala-D-Ala carboxypeptidase/endopeptidase